MLHLGAVIPHLSCAADAHYHHLTDDIIEGGKFKYENGAIKVPTAPGLGVKFNREKLAEYSELYKRLGSYPYDQEPLRKGWTPTIPNNRWADHTDRRTPEIPCSFGKTLKQMNDIVIKQFENRANTDSAGIARDTHELRRQVDEIITAMPVVDLHTHLFPPQFGDLSLFAID